MGRLSDVVRAWFAEVGIENPTINERPDTSYSSCGFYAAVGGNDFNVFIDAKEVHG